ncbi:hypothetical protein [Collimonas arenae]|uniref:hypothetical protein n=1 Tax=Collimonas arenae TaxID=279058 RepID=UPI00056F321F|nr:hypothetical protein [Collimonas arenae]
MRHILFAAIFSFYGADAIAATAIPTDLAGIWATEGTEFSGETLMKGQALYLDTDGMGASIGGDGKAVAGVQVVVTSYSPSTNSLGLDFTENGKVVISGTMTYDPIQRVIFSPTDSKQHYLRRFDALSAETRKSLGLEAREK